MLSKHPSALPYILLWRLLSSCHRVPWRGCWTGDCPFLCLSSVWGPISGLLCFPLSWPTPFLMNHIFTYLPEYKYMEINFFDIVCMSKNVYITFTQLLIFSLNVLVLVRSFQFRCSCLSVPWSFLVLILWQLPSMGFTRFPFKYPNSSAEPMTFETLLPVFHLFFVLIYWETFLKYFNL